MFLDLVCLTNAAFTLLPYRTLRGFQQVELQKTLLKSLPLKLVDKVRKDFRWHARKDAQTF